MPISRRIGVPVQLYGCVIEWIDDRDTACRVERAPCTVVGVVCCTGADCCVARVARLSKRDHALSSVYQAACAAQRQRQIGGSIHSQNTFACLKNGTKTPRRLAPALCLICVWIFGILCERASGTAAARPQGTSSEARGDGAAWRVSL